MIWSSDTGCGTTQVEQVSAAKPVGLEDLRWPVLTQIYFNKGDFFKFVLKSVERWVSIRTRQLFQLVINFNSHFSVLQIMRFGHNLTFCLYISHNQCWAKTNCLSEKLTLKAMKKTSSLHFVSISYFILIQFIFPPIRQAQMCKSSISQVLETNISIKKMAIKNVRILRPT